MGDNSRTESELSFLYMTYQLKVLYNLVQYHEISQRVIKLWPAQDFKTVGGNSRMESVRVVILLQDTPTQGPLHIGEVS